MRKLPVILFLLFLLSSCDPLKTLTIENRTGEPISLLLKHQKGNNYLNNYGNDTIVPFGTSKTNNYWTQIYNIGNWEVDEVKKIMSEVDNSLYFEVYDVHMQRFQYPKVKVIRSFLSKNHIRVIIKE